MRRLGIARSLRSIRHLAVTGAVLGLLASSATLQVSAGVPLSLGNTNGEADGWAFNGTAEWDIDIVNAPTWAFDETRTASGTDSATGRSFTASIALKAGFELATDGAGLITTFHGSARTNASASTDGDSEHVMSIDVPFRAAPGTAVHVQATFESAVDAQGGGYAYGFAGLAVYCVDPSAPTGMSRVEGRAQLEDGGQGSTENIQDPPVDLDLPTASGDCHVLMSSRTDAEGGDDDAPGSAIASSGFEITVTAGECILSGIVSTGIPGIPPAEHSMRGIGVELLDDQDAVVASSVSDREGRYCFRDVDRGDYTIRASLADAEHDPPILRTVHFPSTDVVVTDGAVVEDDFGRDDFGIDFRPTAAEPWRAEVAAIHRESMRFVSWLMESGIASPAELGQVTMQTDSDQGTSYSDVDHVSRIQVSDTRYDERRSPWSQCPENCEWHEIAHHLEDALGFAEADSVPCTARKAHAGWANATSCDSFVEGFASFLSLYGSQTIDAGRQPPYAGPEYSVFGNFEENTNFPWQVWVSGDRVHGREDHAVAQLLVDLVDNTVGEIGDIDFQAQGGGRDFTGHPELISVDGTALIRLFEATTPQTVAELRDVLVASDLVADTQKAVTVDIDEDGTPDVSELDAVFLMHSFYPVADISKPFYRIGDPVGRTDRQPVDPTTGQPFGTPGPVTENREHIPLTPGSAVLLENPRASESTFTVTVTYSKATSTFDVPVAAHGSQLVRLELPLYWTAGTGTGDLPACGAEDHRLVQLEITVSGQAPLTMDSCAYWHAVDAATGDSAVTYAAPADGSATPAPTTAEPSPAAGESPISIVAFGAIGAAIVGVGVVLFVVRRKRPA